MTEAGHHVLAVVGMVRFIIWGDFRCVMTDPFKDKSPAELLAMVQTGAPCIDCEGSGKNLPRGYTEATSIFDWNCPTCHGSALVPLSNADLDALAACVCEGKWVQYCERHPKTNHKKPGWYQYAGYNSWVHLSKFGYPNYKPTTDPVAAMRLQEKYRLTTAPAGEKGWWAHDGSYGEVDAISSGGNLCRAITTAALTAAIEGGSHADD